MSITASWIAESRARDWIAENGAQVEVITDLRYSKATSKPTRWVLVVPEDSPIKTVKDLEGKRIAPPRPWASRRRYLDRAMA